MSSFRLSDPRYESARQDLLRQYGSPHHRCGTFTRLMAEQFPELKRVAGYYHAPFGDVSHGEHWWLETAAGDIVDPTADQFPSNGTGRYVRYDPRVHTTVKGTCMNCGMSLVSRIGTYPCSQSCDEALSKEYGVRLSGGPYELDMDISCDDDVATKYGIQLAALN